MKRGDIVTFADPSAGDFARKPRPALVIQNNAFLSSHASVTVCLITSEVAALPLFRVPLPADGETGLLKPSEISVDKVQTVWTHRIGRNIGRVSDEIMIDVDQALRRWLAL